MNDSQRIVAFRLDMNQSTVYRILRRHRETGWHTRRPGQGRKRINTSPGPMHNIISIRERFVTVPLLQNRMLDKYALRLSENTVSRRLKEDQIHQRRPATELRKGRFYLIKISEFV
jgi:transposase